MSNIKEIGYNGNLVQIEDSERDYLKPYTHQKEIKLTSPSLQALENERKLKYIAQNSRKVEVTTINQYKKKKIKKNV